MFQKQFADIIELIQQSRVAAIKAVNTELVNLYWNVGAYISKQIANASWGDKTVDELAAFIQKEYPELKGFSRAGLYRMIQFYEIYASSAFVAPAGRQMQSIDNEHNRIVAPVVRQLEKDREFVSPIKTQIEIIDIRKSILTQISWTLHLIIFSRCKIAEEREFYIRLAIKEKYSKRELERQINSGIFERIMIGNQQLSPALRENHPHIFNSFKDSYVFEFLNLPEPYNENDVQKGLIKQMKKFILELGKDFLFIAEEYKVQVGKRDFYIDLLFFHRGLQCLVAFELKKEKFEPEHLGKINFYLEALDRDVKKENENLSIGVLLCKDKDSEVVEYALSRSLSPTMVAEYKTQLPDKKLLQQKLHELSELGFFGNID
jgi:predicted nuclease of restriction endonuclease-like (RecB) superfamily